VACAEGAAAVARAKAAGIAMTAETCPHYLVFASGDIPDGATEFKCAPPIRTARHREALWMALSRGALDLIATDHSPAPSALKCPGDFLRAWGGIASLELSLAAVWTSMPRAEHDLSPHDVARWLSTAPAALAGLSRRKGRIEPGLDADLAVWDPDAEFVVDATRLQQRHKLTPYAGRRLRGVVTTTFLRGRRIWHDGALVSERSGQLL
jgi:allantoinase